MHAVKSPQTNILMHSYFVEDLGATSFFFNMKVIYCTHLERGYYQRSVLKGLNTLSITKLIHRSIMQPELLVITTLVPVRFPFPNMFPFILTYFTCCYVLFYFILFYNGGCQSYFTVSKKVANSRDLSNNYWQPLPFFKVDAQNIIYVFM